ncbi:hypothetical protein [Arcticibacter sp. MXS-1]|uniref:hypothetical protein n=1 Tax=Arcticibacter sp. MXS-1 TaxID=3341726 RepID=UPI0035A89AF4
MNGHKDGYNLQVGPVGQQLPNSIVSKILLARCFLSKPALLILENGWQGVEAKHRKDIIDYLVENKSFSLLVVSELDELCSRCDKTVSLN